MTDLHELMNDLEAFVYKHVPQYRGEDVRTTLIKHYSYNTLDWVEKNGKIVAVVRYNISKSGSIAEIHDLIIEKGQPGIKIMKLFLARGWSRFPNLISIKFRRGLRDDKPDRLYRLRDFFKRRKK